MPSEVGVSTILPKETYFSIPSNEIPTPAKVKEIALKALENLKTFYQQIPLHSTKDSSFSFTSRAIELAHNLLSNDRYDQFIALFQEALPTHSSGDAPSIYNAPFFKIYSELVQNILDAEKAKDAPLLDPNQLYLLEEQSSSSFIALQQLIQVVKNLRGYNSFVTQRDLLEAYVNGLVNFSIPSDPTALPDAPEELWQSFTATAMDIVDFLEKRSHEYVNDISRRIKNLPDITQYPSLLEKKNYMHTTEKLAQTAILILNHFQAFSHKTSHRVQAIKNHFESASCAATSCFKSLRI